MNTVICTRDLPLPLRSLRLEHVKVAELHETYRKNLKGRYSREGASRWICATSQIPKTRVARYLKALPLGHAIDFVLPEQSK